MKGLTGLYTLQGLEGLKVIKNIVVVAQGVPGACRAPVRVYPASPKVRDSLWFSQYNFEQDADFLGIFLGLQGLAVFTYSFRKLGFVRGLYRYFSLKT